MNGNGESPYRTQPVHFPKDEKKRRIKLNSIKCTRCGTVLVSTYVHDFNGCKCVEESRVYVDGGKDYLRRLGGNYEELSTYEEEE